MTIYQYALYRYAGQHMTPEEHQLAVYLAKKADRGDAIARGAFLQLVIDVLADSERHERPAYKKL
jgi:hypothetical protein